MSEKLVPPPKEGNVRLPNGCTLYWKETDQGREYFSDEVGGGVFVWNTALVDDSTLLAAIVKEMEFQKLECVIKERSREPYTPNNPAPGCIRYVGDPPIKVEDVFCTCYYCNDQGDFS